jgi:myo-inositol 2-dehydrogenase/D-chiro-inositol 1-dehydrogenase
VNTTEANHAAHGRGSSDTDILNVGVIGVGGMGGRHARNLTREVPGVQIVALMDLDDARMDAVAAETGAHLRFTDGHALIDHPDVDAVVIAVPDRFHAALARHCIDAGKPVLCEKPLAVSAAEALTVVEAELAAGQRLLQLGFMREFDPAHTRVRDACARGDIGPLRIFRSMHSGVNTGAPRTIEDVITNSAIHDIHSARWLMPGEITRVFTTRVAAPDKPDTANAVLITLEFADGAVGLIDCNVDSGYGYEVDVSISGAHGVASTNALQSAVVRRANRREQWIEDDWLQRFDVAYIAEARAWAQSVRSGTPIGPSAWDGYMSQVVADACIASARSGLPQAVPAVVIPNLYRKIVT